MIRTLLIANRGEIACRICRTAGRLGIRTVAVYSEADAGALHVKAADMALPIGPAAAADSYLRADRIVEAARRAGADAVHPGYGFLAENAGFAEACAVAGLVFVGPPPSAIAAMGSKAGAKALMEAAGVPLVPGYHGDAQDAGTLAAAADGIGFPVLLKASAGGGGKGMRVVTRAEDLADEIAAARREARSAFGDDRLILERYLERPRHVEMQVFADGHGNVVHLFERDCSVQRRHQKVLEEAPAPGLDPATRAAMADAAVAAARAIGYVGAGTVEFIMDEAGRFYFMEMNTRLQVEHPVTEMITGLDLVEWQLRVAAGGPLPLAQEQIRATGHAIEARLYAEDPGRDFLPQTGRLTRLRFPPADGRHVRVDAGVAEGDQVSVHYDPMIAKIIAWDRDRPSALARLAGALGATEVAGLATNLAFLGRVARHADFAAGGVSTGFIAANHDALVPPDGPPGARALILAALAVMLRRASEAAALAAASPDPHAPWHRTDGWRLNTEARHELTFRAGGEAFPVRLRFRRRGYLVEEPGDDRSGDDRPDGDRAGGGLAVDGTLSADGRLEADLGGDRVSAGVDFAGDRVTVFTADGAVSLTLDDPARAGQDTGEVGGGLTAPMPGKVIAVLVEPGQAVDRGTRLLVLEAMKMEHAIAAPADGTVTAVHYAVGELVEEGAALVAFTPAGAEG